MLSSNQIRQQFLDFFASKGHRVVASSPLVPGNDPTLMFTNSGMVQFKDTFLGAEKRDYTRAATAQRCVRAGGKHNDLENVGYTARHHTFFEMLGNFSFGDYFKRDAIHFAWELLTGVYGLPSDKLWVTVYHTDDEAYGYWHDEIGVPAERIVRIGDNKGAPYASDNFWQMADTGPCGPCSEIFFDHGAEIPGGPPGSPDEDGDRYIEIWNLVFMQFERHPDGTLTRLPAPCVDTGMGLERLTAVLQHVHSNYEIDAFQQLIAAAAVATGCSDLGQPSLKVIADHIRACSFLIVDGVLPSNEGRGYVLRRIIRRALRHGWKLGRKEPFFASLVSTLVSIMGQAYPELARKQEMVTQALLAEEVRFSATLDNGMAELTRFVEEAARAQAEHFAERLGYRVEKGFGGVGSSLGEAEANRRDSVELLDADDRLIELEYIQADNELHFVPVHGGETRRIDLAKLGIKLPGKYVFKLYDTYGFPADLTADIARERGIGIDEAGFRAEMDKQRERAREASKFGGGFAITAEQVQGLPATAFLGYAATAGEGLEVLKILVDGKQVDELVSGDTAVVILRQTPFYAESGGQVGDTGTLSWQDGAFEVSDTVKLAGTYHGHVGSLRQGRLASGQQVQAQADAARRSAIKANHSATHLLHAALRSVLGEHVTQKGSLVAPDRLRFDFSHFQPISREQLRQIERMVNAEIQRNDAVDAREMGFEDAIAAGAMALFGEKYGDHVRVLSMGEFSTELCGGTHVGRTGDIGVFKILSEGGVASGIRRIEAVTAAGALAHLEAAEDRLREVAQRIGGGSGDEVVAKLDALLGRQKQLERELDQLKAKAAGAGARDLAAQAVDLGGFKFLAARVEGVEPKALREMVDQLKADLVDAAVLLAGARDGKVNLIAGVSGVALGKVKAGELLGEVARQIGGKGGGRPDLAQGGGDDVPQLPQVLASAREWVSARV